MVKKQTISKMIALHLKSIGVQSIFGVPGGGSSLDLIDAAESVGIKFYSYCVCVWHNGFVQQYCACELSAPF